MQNFVFGNFGLKILDLKNIPSHTYAFLFLKLNALSQIISFFLKTGVFSKNWWVSAWFDRSILFFDRSKFFKIVKIWERESLSVSTGRGWFSTDRNSYINFFKKLNWTFSKSLFKLFQAFLSLRVGSRLHHLSFCRFPSNFLQGFCPWKPVSPFCPSFSSFVLFFMHSHGYFRHLHTYWGFWWFKPILVQLINGFLCHDVILMFPIV